MDRVHFIELALLTRLIPRLQRSTDLFGAFYLGRWPRLLHFAPLALQGNAPYLLRVTGPPLRRVVLTRKAVGAIDFTTQLNTLHS